MVELPEGYEWRDGADAAEAHAFLTTSYWNEGISLDLVSRAIGNSHVISIWHGDRQIAMARLITDRVTIAYLNDVYVLPPHRGKGLAGAMIERLRADARFAEVGRWLLFTKDAQAFYEAHGWKRYPWPERTMLIDRKVFQE